MSRVQFVETVTVPGGPAGTLLPLAGIAATPYIVNPDGSESSQATAYADRTSLVSPSLVTDSTGTVSFWLDAGDYDVHMDDQQSPPRIQSYIRGFTAPIIDTAQVVVAAQNLIQFTGDTKFSFQTADHGLKADGSYEWLLVTNDVDGGGRKLDHTVYAGIWAEVGSPAPDSAGKFRLPNISGRALIAAGAASGLTARTLFSLFGEESHVISIAEMAVHNHWGNSGNDTPDHHHHIVAQDINPSSSGFGFLTSSQSVGGGVADGQNTTPGFGNGTTTIGVPSNNNNPWGPLDHGVFPAMESDGASGVHHHNIPYDGGTTSSGGAVAGITQAHNNMQPSFGINLFVKS